MESKAELLAEKIWGEAYENAKRYGAINGISRTLVHDWQSYLEVLLEQRVKELESELASEIKASAKLYKENIILKDKLQGMDLLFEENQLLKQGMKDLERINEDIESKLYASHLEHCSEIEKLKEDLTDSQILLEACKRALDDNSKEFTNIEEELKIKTESLNHALEELETVTKELTATINHNLNLQKDYEREIAETMKKCLKRIRRLRGYIKH